MTDDDRLAADTRLGRLSVTVPSIDETVPFYRDVVGLAIHERSGSRIVLGAPEQPLLELLEDPSASPRRGTEAGLYHYALRVPRRAALGAALERIQGGWQLDGAADHGVSEALYLRDPAENGIEIYWDRPRESWPIDETGQVQMKTSPLDLDAIRAASNNGATVPVDTDLGHVHLEVLDVAAAREFYVDALGMNVRAEYSPSALFVAAGDYHHHVGLNTWNGRTEPAMAGSVGINWFEVVVPDASELRRAVDQLLDHGIDVVGDGGELQVVDPAGIPVRLRPAVGVASPDDASAERSG